MSTFFTFYVSGTNTENEKLLKTVHNFIKETTFKHKVNITSISFLACNYYTKLWLDLSLLEVMIQIFLYQ